MCNMLGVYLVFRLILSIMRSVFLNFFVHIKNTVIVFLHFFYSMYYYYVSLFSSFQLFLELELETRDRLLARDAKDDLLEITITYVLLYASNLLSILLIPFPFHFHKRIDDEEVGATEEIIPHSNSAKQPRGEKKT
jgi:hypothetical protein